MRITIKFKPEVVLTKEDSERWIDAKTFFEIGYEGMLEVFEDDPTALLGELGGLGGIIESIGIISDAAWPEWERLSLIDGAQS